MADEMPVTQTQRPDVDLVRHHYSRRVQWGTDAVLYRKSHPMIWSKMEGNYQNWELDTSDLVPADAHSPDGEPTKLFYSDDLTVWFSRRRESMRTFARNGDADELHLISQGSMLYETDFGDIRVESGDFLLLPKGVTYRALLDQPQETVRLIYESVPELFMVPAEMVEHLYHKGRSPVAESRLQYPTLRQGPTPDGPFEMRIKYHGAFSDWLGETSTIVYDTYPFDAEIIDGFQPVFKFNVNDIERLGGVPVAFVGAAYLDNQDNVAWTLHLTGGGAGAGFAPVHRNPDADELRFLADGEKAGTILFSPQGVDHGAGRGYTKAERNRPDGPYDRTISISAYTRVALKGTAEALGVASPSEVA